MEEFVGLFRIILTINSFSEENCGGATFMKEKEKEE